MFDKIPAALFRIRFDGARFIFTDANAGGHLLTQGKVADLFGRDVFDIWKKANNRHLAENTKRAFESGERIEETFWHTFVSDKQRRYVNAHYVPLGGKEVLLCINDLTDEKYRAEQLTHLESRYRALFERSDTGLLEGLPTKFFDCNNQIARIFGYSKHEFLKLNLSDIAEQKELPKLEILLGQSRSNPYKLLQWEGCAVRKNGESFWVHIELTGIVGKKGEFGHYLASLTEITDRKNSEETLRSALVDTVKAVASTVEVHDAYTSGHMDRVAEICAAMAGELGLTDDEILGLSLGASIHDIGKVGIPSSILSKPTRLSKAEFDLIKEHPKLGWEIIKDIQFPWPVREMVIQHHERLDGSGYPEGLHSDTISREAKILAVADVFEAVTTHRPYRPARSLADAVKILEEEKNAGKLESQYVDCLLDLVETGQITASQVTGA